MSEEDRLAVAIQQVLDGNKEQYETIYRAVDGSLHAFLHTRFGRCGGDFVDEVANRTHICMLNNLHKFDPGRGTVAAWMMLQARNEARLVFGERYPRRAARVDQPTLEAWAVTSTGPAEESEAARRVRVIREELDDLPGDGRAVVELHDFEGRTLAETAQMLGIPVGRARRERDKVLDVLRRRLPERDVHATVRDTTPVPVFHGWDTTGYVDDWSETVGARQPDEPEGPLDGRDEEEMTM